MRHETEIKPVRAIYAAEICVNGLLFFRWRLIAGLLLGFILVSASAIASPSNAIVEIQTTSHKYSYLSPWQSGHTEYISGSGCVIKGNQILTNAHVVENQTYIIVQKNGDPERYPARVLFISHDADLALLTVDNPKFFAGVKPLLFGGLPKLLDSVAVYGFPSGGSTMSVTKGVVSRIEETEYVHSEITLLAVQLDAAINGGNSGGPAILDGKIVGIVMQVNSELQSVGYIVPTPVIEHFLKDISDGNYDGFPEDGVRVQWLINPALRKAVGLGEGESGGLVVCTIPGAPSEGLLQRGDVILKIDGKIVYNDFTTRLRDDLLVSGDYPVKERQIGEVIKYTILRDRKSIIEVDVPLTMKWGDESLVRKLQYEHKPNYIKIKGFVFTELSYNLIKENSSEKKLQNMATYWHYYDKDREKPGQRIVVISDYFPDDFNYGYHWTLGKVVSKINGVEVFNLEQMQTILNSREDFVLEVADGLVYVGG